MLLTNRHYVRQEPSRDAKSIFIFCEGKRREIQYFRYFEALDSRIRIMIYQLQQHENNSPTGLYSIASNLLIKTIENPNPKFEFIAGDEVWFVIDTDTWGSKISELRKLCKDKKKWSIAQSNPCFEVWLYFHFFSEIPKFLGMEESKKWKSFINQKIKGGFSPKIHPIYIETAIINSKNNFRRSNSAPSVGSTEVYKLGKTILPFVKEKLKAVMPLIIMPILQ